MSLDEGLAEVTEIDQLRTANGRWFSSAVETWETHVAKCESESKDMIDDGGRLRIVTYHSRAPDPSAIERFRSGSVPRGAT